MQINHEQRPKYASSSAMKLAILAYELRSVGDVIGDFAGRTNAKYERFIETSKRRLQVDYCDREDGRICSVTG